MSGGSLRAQEGMRFDAAAIAAATGGVAHGDATGWIGTDTRVGLDGAWFVALQGARFDAHDHLASAAGAAGAVLARPVDGWDRPWVQVDDTTRALADLGRAARARLAVPVVGLTGSAGKTTTRALIACALAQLGRVHQTVGNLNNHLGVPMTLLATPADAAAVVVEMGTSSPGEIGLLAEIARPTARLIVNVGHAHLEELGGLDGVAREKGALFDTAGPDDLVAINLDDPRIAAMRPPGRQVTWGRHPAAHVRLLRAEVDPERFVTRAVWRTPVGEVESILPTLGDHIAHNAAGALAIAWGLGLDVGRAALDLGHYETVGMRLLPVALPGGVVALNDAYNANPTSMRASLGVLASLPGRRVAVIGDMLELGSAEAELHAEVVRYARDLDLDLLVFVGPRMAAAAETTGGVSASVWAASDGLAVVPALSAWLAAGDRVLFKGSRSTRVERILEAVAEARRGEASCSTT